MLREMSSAERAGWVWFFEREPWGFREENRRMSVLAWTVAKFSGRAKPSLKVEAFMPKTAADKPVSVADRIKAAFGFKPPARRSSNG